MGEKLPVRVYLKEEVIEALKDAAENQTEEMTYNEVASEIISRCLPIWLEARQAFDGVFEDYLHEFGKLVKSRRKP